jgi:hypothetical protein
MKLPSLLRPVKDHLGLRTPGDYRIPCECGRVYIGQMGCSVDIRLKEHQRHSQLEHPDKSAVDEHSINQGHRIQVHNSSILATKNRYMGHIVREAIEIELQPYNINHPTPTLEPKLGILLCSLAIYKHTPLPATLVSASSIWYSILTLPF